MAKYVVNYNDVFGTLLECPVCKKTFLKPAENIYKLTINGNIEHYCSYTCYRKMQKVFEEELERKSKARNEKIKDTLIKKNKQKREGL